MGVGEMAQWAKYEELSLNSEHLCRKDNMVAEASKHCWEVEMGKPQRNSG